MLVSSHILWLISVGASQDLLYSSCLSTYHRSQVALRVANEMPTAWLMSEALSFKLIILAKLMALLILVLLRHLQRESRRFKRDWMRLRYLVDYRDSR